MMEIWLLLWASFFWCCTALMVVFLPFFANKNSVTTIYVLRYCYATLRRVCLPLTCGSSLVGDGLDQIAVVSSSWTAVLFSSLVSLYMYFCHSLLLSSAVDPNHLIDLLLGSLQFQTSLLYWGCAQLNCYSGCGLVRQITCRQRDSVLLLLMQHNMWL